MDEPLRPAPGPWLGALDIGLWEAVFHRQSDQPFFVKDAELRYVAANPVMLRLVGARGREDLIGRSARDLFPADEAVGYEALDREVLSTAQPIIDRLHFAASLQAPANWLLFSRYPVRDPTGETVGVLALARALPTGGRADPVHRRVAQVLNHVREHFQEPLVLGELAALAGVSPSQIERDVSRVTGAPLRDYHRRVRLDAAMRLLREGGSVAQAAHEAGYADHSAFSRQFRRATGLTPIAYRRQLGS